MTEIYRSSCSHDTILVTLYKKSHRVSIKIKHVELPQEHIKLVLRLARKLKYMNIKWVEFNVEFDAPPIIPPNTISYIGSNKNFVCHIEDFIKFYFANLKTVIKWDNIYYRPSTKTIDGWTYVPDHKKAKKETHAEIIDMISAMYLETLT